MSRFLALARPRLLSWRLLSDNFLIAAGLVLIYSMTISLGMDIIQVFSTPPGLDGAAKIAAFERLSLKESLSKDIPIQESPPAPEDPGLPSVALAEPVDLPTPAAPDIPVSLRIPAIDLEAPIIPAGTQEVWVDGETYRQWLPPDQFAAGWHADSAWLGEPGNTVLNGHHNINGQVFARLVDLKEGDWIIVNGRNREHVYVITNRMILPEKYEELDVRMDNARWILPSTDERLTLVTCWPAESNTHRLILVAVPVKTAG